MDSSESVNSKSTKQVKLSSNARPLSIEGPCTSNSSKVSSSSLQPLPNQPRQPTNLGELLKYAVGTAQTENAENNQQIYPMDDERKTFLNNALSSLTVNVTEELQKALQILHNVVNLQTSDDSSEYEVALTNIWHYVQSMDIANDFYKIGGFAVFQSCLNSSHSNIRWRTADVIAALTQNNPFCQEKMLETKLFPLLISMVEKDQCELARIKALYAVSCIVRGNPIAIKHLESNDGYSVLLRVLESPIETLQMKSLFLLSILCSSEDCNIIKYTLLMMGFMEKAAGLLSKHNLKPMIRERLLITLCDITNNFEPAVERGHNPQLGLKINLELLLNKLKDDQDKNSEQDNQNEIDLCSELLKKIFPNSENVTH